MEQTIKGTIHLKYEAKKVTEKLTVRDFVIKVGNETYPQFVIIQLINDNVSLLDQFQVNEMVGITYLLRGREYNGKYYNTVQAVRIERLFQ
jgi:hypothetical protein